MFPLLTGGALAAEIRLDRGWQSLVSSVPSTAPSVSCVIEHRFRSFAGTFVTARTITVGLTISVGFHVMLGQSLLVGQLVSLEPYFSARLIVVTSACAFVAAMSGLLTLMAHVPFATLPRQGGAADGAQRVAGG
jgi:hypothetical protein